MTQRDLPAWLDRRELPFLSRFVDVPGGTLHYVDEGAGAPVVLVHGTPTWSFEYRHVVRVLGKTHRCLAPDHLGFGLSDRPADAEYTPEAHAARFAAFVDTVLPTGRFTLVVHDFGGPIALAYALAHPERIERVVLLNTWAWSFDDDATMRGRAKLAGTAFFRWCYRWLNFSLRVLMPSAYGDRRKLTKAVHAQYLAPFRDRGARVLVLWALARAMTASSAFFASLESKLDVLRSLPVAIVWGMRDSAFQPEQLARWRRHLPNAQVVELARAGHWPHEEAPDEVVAAIASFVHPSALTAAAA